MWRPRRSRRGHELRFWRAEASPGTGSSSPGGAWGHGQGGRPCDSEGGGCAGQHRPPAVGGLSPQPRGPRPHCWVFLGARGPLNLRARGAHSYAHSTTRVGLEEPAEGEGSCGATRTHNSSSTGTAIPDSGFQDGGGENAPRGKLNQDIWTCIWKCIKELKLANKYTEKHSCSLEVKL